MSIESVSNDGDVPLRNNKKISLNKVDLIFIDAYLWAVFNINLHGTSRSNITKGGSYAELSH
jgi:hypothetical protein